MATHGAKRAEPENVAPHDFADLATLAGWPSESGGLAETGRVLALSHVSSAPEALSGEASAGRQDAGTGGPGDPDRREELARQLDDPITSGLDAAIRAWEVARDPAQLRRSLLAVLVELDAGGLQVSDSVRPLGA